MAMRFVYDSAIGQFAANVVATRNILARAATGAIAEVTDLAKTAARAAIAGGGMSKKWQNALRTKVFPKGGVALDPTGFVYHKIPYADVFQTGATITPLKNFLWLPLPSAPRVSGNHALSPQKYIETIGPLRRVNRDGKPPLLVGRATKISNRQGAGRFGPIKQKFKNFAARRAFKNAPYIPLYIGELAVTLKQKFDVKGPIALVVASKLNDIYVKKLEDN